LGDISSCPILLLLARLLFHIGGLLKVKSDGLGPVAKRFTKLSNGVDPTDPSQSDGTKSLITRNRSHTRKRALRRHMCIGLSCRVTSSSASHSAPVSGTTYSAPLSPARKLATVGGTKDRCWEIPFPPLNAPDGFTSDRNERIAHVLRGQIKDQEAHRHRSADHSQGRASIPVFQPRARRRPAPSCVRFANTRPARRRP
jgi:hypothetical protein